jgi:branched-subunit amino acid transport protein
MSFADYLWLVAGMGLVTYLPRWLPLCLLANRQLPAWLEEWLDLLPVALLGALLAPILVTTGTPRSLDLGRPELWVAVPTLLFALRTRSLGGTVVVGMALFWLATSLA